MVKKKTAIYLHQVRQFWKSVKSWHVQKIIIQYVFQYYHTINQGMSSKKNIFEKLWKAPSYKEKK